MGGYPRIHVPGRIHHVMTRGNGGQAILTSTDEFAELRDVITAVKKTSDFSLYAYCLMSNHFHLLLQVATVPLSRIMQRIKTTWSKRFNIERRRMGHVFQGRFKSISCDDDAYFKWLLRYIHLNPVHAGLVELPDQWQWSSYREYLGLSDEPLADVAWPLSLFASERDHAVDTFREFVLQGLKDDTEPRPMFDSRVQTPLVERPSSASEERRPLAEIAGRVAAETGMDASAILGSSRRRDISSARRCFAAHAIANGYGVAELARALGVSTTAVSRMLRWNDLPPAIRRIQGANPS